MSLTQYKVIQVICLPLGITVQHWIIYSSFLGRCVANFHTALMGIRLPALNPNSSSAPQHDCEVLLSKGGVNSYVGTDRTVTAGRSMWVSLNKTWEKIFVAIQKYRQSRQHDTRHVTNTILSLGQARTIFWSLIISGDSIFRARRSTYAAKHLLADAAEGATARRGRFLHVGLPCSHFQVEIQSSTCPGRRDGSHLCIKGIQKRWVSQHKPGGTLNPNGFLLEVPEAIFIWLKVCLHPSRRSSAPFVGSRAQGTKISSENRCWHLVPCPSHTSRRVTQTISSNGGSRSQLRWIAPWASDTQEPFAGGSH